MKQKPRSPTGPDPLEERDWGLAGILLLVTSASLTVFLLVSIEKDWVNFGERPPVTVQSSSNGPRTAGPGGGSAQWPDPDGNLGQMLADGLVLSARVIDGRVAGYLITPHSEEPILSAAKLRPGDILIDVDGRPLDDARIGELRRELADADSVDITLQRNGHIRKRVIDLRR